MRKNSDLKRFFLKCWVRLTVFLQWVEKHPLIDRIVLFIVKIVMSILTRK